ncbi:limonoid 21-O-acetyltransferse [Nicotiana tabacum]|uniref:Acetyl-CoA-benzylalcohol acetyltransferase n=1 Tax=Nicotiana tabacum TaxID=4097 RepID=A0A1S4BEV6_TOBAC|nr:PREDICTED: acetyl-CoA-benzylalcohol acetyltransferase-like [Nicotiana tabacum]
MGFLCANLKKSMVIEIMSKKLVKPSSPTPTHFQSYKLSFFDQLAIKMHVPIVLIYHNLNNSITDELLEESLSKTLTHVYPSAGRINKDRRVVDCLDQGVEFIIAKVNCQLEDFLEQARNDIDLANHFWPQGIKDVDDNYDFAITPLVFVQVTRFECGGLALSVAAEHIAIDGFTNMKFIYEWAKVCRLGIPSSTTDIFNYDLGDIFPARDTSRILKPLASLAIPKDTIMYVAKRFVFNEASISKLRNKIANSIASGVLGFKPSRVEMITSLLWRALIRASQAKNGRLRPSLMSFPVNLRGKASVPKLANAFGNFAVEVPVVFTPNETKMELHNLIALIRDATDKTMVFSAKASNDELVSMAANLYNMTQEWEANEEVDEFTCSSLCRFPMKEADFGLGKPCWMTFGLRQSQVFWLYDADCGSSIAAQVDLNESLMHHFERDQDLNTFTILNN